MKATAAGMLAGLVLAVATVALLTQSSSPQPQDLGAQQASPPRRLEHVSPCGFYGSLGPVQVGDFRDVGVYGLGHSVRMESANPAVATAEFVWGPGDLRVRVFGVSLGTTTVNLFEEDGSICSTLQVSVVPHCSFAVPAVTVTVGASVRVGVNWGAASRVESGNLAVATAEVILDGAWDTVVILGVCPGVTTVSLIDDYERVCALIDVIVVVGDPPPTFQPTAIASTSTPQIPLGGTARLDGSESHDNDEGGATVVEWRWQFDNMITPENDIFTVTANHPVHLQTLPVPGEYLVTLTVKDDEGEISTPDGSDSHVSITVWAAETELPTAAAKTSTPVIKVGGTATLDGTGSDDNDRVGIAPAIHRYEWRLVDRAGVNPSLVVESMNAKTTTDISGAGEWDATLIVIDNDGEQSAPSAMVLIKVVLVEFKPDPVNVLVKGSANVTVAVSPPSAVGDVTFSTENEALAKVLPTSITSTPGTLTVSGVAAGTTALNAQISTEVIETAVIHIVQDFAVHITSIKNHKSLAISDPGGLCLNKNATYSGSVEPDLSASGMTVQWYVSVAGTNNFVPFADPGNTGRGKALVSTITENSTGTFDIRLTVKVNGETRQSVEARKVIVIMPFVGVVDRTLNQPISNGGIAQAGHSIVYVGRYEPVDLPDSRMIQWQFAPHGTGEDDPGWKNFVSGHGGTDFPTLGPVQENTPGDFDIRLAVAFGGTTCYSAPFRLFIAKASLSVTDAARATLTSPAEICVGDAVTYTGAYVPSTLLVNSKEWQFSTDGQNTWQPFASGQGWPSQSARESNPGDFNVRLMITATGPDGSVEMHSDPYRMVVYRVTITANDGATDPATRFTHPALPSVPEWGAAWIGGDPVIPAAQGARKAGDVILTAGFTPSTPVPTSFSWIGPGTTTVTTPFRRNIPRSDPARNLVNANIGSHTCASAIVWVVGVRWGTGAFSNSGQPRSDILRIEQIAALGGRLGEVGPGDGSNSTTNAAFIPVRPGDGAADSPTDGTMTQLSYTTEAITQLWLATFRGQNLWTVEGTSVPSSETERRIRGRQRDATTGVLYSVDDGTVSFRIDTGTRPFLIGDRFNFSVIRNGNRGFHNNVELQATIDPHEACGHPDINFDIRRARVARVWRNGQNATIAPDRTAQIPNPTIDDDAENFDEDLRHSRSDCTIESIDTPGPVRGLVGGTQSIVWKVNFSESVDVLFNNTLNARNRHTGEKCSEDWEWSIILSLRSSDTLPPTMQRDSSRANRSQEGHLSDAEMRTDASLP